MVRKKTFNQLIVENKLNIMKDKTLMEKIYTKMEERQIAEKEVVENTKN